ncbi:unnamed protein product [Onchocerca flexuosa]|uniref:Uncharacterized protein n=1 Tax=Onchocerca flexuosa TaxID=387005 RepID=A0A183I6D3_9BILA|nr:unnamed protein product [Onchocerca flexuosa]
MKPINHLTQGGCNEVENNRVRTLMWIGSGSWSSKECKKSERNILTRCFYFILKLGTINPGGTAKTLLILRNNDYFPVIMAKFSDLSYSKPSATADKMAAFDSDLNVITELDCINMRILLPFRVAVRCF